LYGTPDGLGIEISQFNGINKLTYIQLDISNVQHSVLPGTIPTITIDDIQPMEGFRICGSNIEGEIGSTLYISDDSTISQTIPIPYFKTYRFISITAHGSSKTASVSLKSIKYIV